ncbi:MAG: type II toxin-antitoxin system PemK/MazF family toxin [Bifidobacteriaceae bacterium]|jgi:mRNA interferase MazF|nr:type II toxin-antitoxin system PemK/MazF family toxin [Bifidobacteriaceae bacterium]
MDSTDARRGQLWLADLGANRAGELGKTRPVVIMTMDELVPGNPDDLLIVVPLSASREPTFLRIEIIGVDGIDRPSVAVVTSARAIARSRLRAHLGELPSGVLAEVTRRLTWVIGGPRAL